MSAADGPRRLQVTVDGRAVRVLEQGSGPPVVLVHGLGLSATVWEPHLAHLAEAGYRGIAPDLPGFGRSPGPITGMSVPRVARWLVRLADTLDLGRAAWIGHSLGSQHAVRLAVDAPGRAAALVLAAPTGRAGRHVIRPPLGLLATAVQERPTFVAGVVRRYLRSPVTAVAAWTRSLSHDTALDAPLVACPAMLVIGDDDAVVPESFVEQLARLIPTAHVERLEGATHAVALEPVPPFMTTVLRFLDARYRGSRTERWNASSIAPKSHGSSGP